MKLILNNLVYETTNEVKIARLKELGAEELDVEEEVKEEKVIKLNTLNKTQLVELANERGIEVPDGATNKELVALLEEE